MNRLSQFLTIGFLCCSSVFINAAAAVDSEKKTSSSPLTSASFSEKEFMDNLQKEIKNGGNEDILLKLLLMTPYEKRQYIFPFIHEEPFLSHKLKSHPDVLFWKNKKPTVIAPQLAEFSKKYLNDLPAALYPFLDPDFWKDPPLEQKPQLYAIDLNTQPLSITRTPDYKYPVLESLFKLSGETLKNYQKTDLTETDINRITTVLNHFNSYAKNLKDPQTTQMYLRNLNSEIIRASLADPFAVFAENIKKIGEKESFESFIQTNGFKTLEEFTDKADRLLKAYRAQNLNLLLAIQFNHIRADMPLDKKEMNSTQMYARMYQVQPGDIYFAAKHKEKLKNTFPAQELVYWGIPIYID